MALRTRTAPITVDCGARTKSEIKEPEDSGVVIPRSAVNLAEKIICSRHDSLMLRPNLPASHSGSAARAET